MAQMFVNVWVLDSRKSMPGINFNMILLVVYNRPLHWPNGNFSKSDASYGSLFQRSF